MGELILLTGGSKSGKSALAEALAVDFGPPLYYIATMQPFGAEAHAAIARHRAQRAGKGFTTCQQPTDLQDLRLPPGCAALVEDLGNLLANETFSARAQDPVGKICAGIAALRAQTGLLVLVGNQVDGDGIAYPPETQAYVRHMGTLACQLARQADRVIEAVCGLPLMLKGVLPPCLAQR
ncbi:bifunctional adenosylcobinamide kinase/adenosylcobinamide-phosphate guanylyltransferase [Acutalibacter caecimuris]|uniref:bifunctional adenosylcobinamide kinase/adenosylcobinamide-phosphate guanylyltransferase n=1 Tax=Acutalibacter caecimuris TaxID=3093657 RepID=UPI002AC960E5|nr:bifunctional adenosylcobinamide kinase/adenosylcobinamide-phosphate guanylyltransferase [Acutalibacter sp. M00118]